MPRRERMYVPGLPYHIVQRGNNREVCFVEPENYQYYLELWKEYSRRYGVLVHAYCLMTNHYHLLLQTKEQNISNAIKQLNGNYSIYFNKKYKRNGHLWQGRFSSFFYMMKFIFGLLQNI